MNLTRQALPGNYRPVQQTLLGNHLYKVVPKGLNIAPLRDYLVQDASAMLLSYLRKRGKGDLKANPPTLPGLAAPDSESIQRATDEFTSRIEFGIKPAQEMKIATARAENRTRVAQRLSNTYKSWAATKAAARMLKSVETSTALTTPA